MHADAESTTNQDIPAIADLLLRGQSAGAAGRLLEAEAAYHAVLGIDASHAGATHLLGLLEVQLGRPAALVRLATALKAAPQEERYWLSYVGALVDSGEFHAAAQVLDMGRQRGLAGAAVDALAARLLPAGADRTDAVMALLAAGRIDDAFDTSKALVAQFPSDPFGWKIQAAVSRMRGQHNTALGAMQHALACAPDDAESHANLGSVFNDLERRPEAEAAFRRSLDLLAETGDQAAIALAWNGLGVALHDRPRQAEAAFRRALQLDPDVAGAANNLAKNLQQQGRVPEAVEAYRRALARQPGAHDVHSNLLFCLSELEDFPVPALFAAHQAFGKALAAAVRGAPPAHANPRDPGRPMRIGFVSGDLRNHALASFFEPLLASLAGRPGVELTAYYNHPVHDDVTARLRTHVALWRDIHHQSDEVVAAGIRADAIDILIDLSGHTAYNRLPLFAMKAAPIQATWLGYPGTTGLAAIDYCLVDRYLLPPGRFDGQFTEQLVQLPVGAPFQVVPDAPPVSPLPALDRGFVTFGSFNRPSKISRRVVALWARLLRALPHARLLIGAMPEDGSASPLAAWLVEEGIARDRVDFHKRSSLHAYLALHQQVDICLDTFPYSGGTTTQHALSMGVPTLTIAGDTAAGRQSACILEHNALLDYVAADGDDFVRKGMAASAALDALARLRAGLRERFPPAPLSYYNIVADSVEAAFRTMWQRWCDKLPPASFSVPPPPPAPAPSPIYVTRPDLPPLQEMLPLLSQIWENKFVTNGGPFHAQLESALCDYLGVEHISLFTNGTIALMTALQALGIHGEVITTPYSFVATAHALRWNGITPVFADIDPATFNLDPAAIEGAITARTTAIMPVHCYGRPCDTAAIETIARRHGLKVIYDAAHAFAVRQDGVSVLRQGDLSVLSFHATKVFNTFEGGAIVSGDLATKRNIDNLKNFGIVDEVTVSAAGINGKMSEFNAALGLVQLRHIDAALARRADIARLYRRSLDGVPGIACPPDGANVTANNAYFPILVGPQYAHGRDALYRRLLDAGIMARRYFYPLISEFSMYSQAPSATPSNLPHAVRAAAQVICLPIYPALEDDQLRRIVALIRQ